MPILSDSQLARLADQIKSWGKALGFQQVGISDVHLDEAEQQLHDWLAKGLHGEMGYMAKHGTRRSRPAELEPGTQRVISVRMDYLPAASDMQANLDDAQRSYISRYALGRDYHKLMRNRLQKLANQISHEIGEFGYRAFVDSAPVLEKAIAAKAGLGWVGKHSNLLNSEAGSWFFLGELYTDLALPVDDRTTDHCGTCTTCLDVCPTRAIIAPYIVDARRCISYLTIELRGAIPVELRPLIGNRIYGCDDCQLYCPWNRFAELTAETDFQPRHQLDALGLIDAFSWDEETFQSRTEGSAIRRIGHERWLRNIAVALGNAPPAAPIITALKSRADHPSALVREHVSWALSRQIR
ncbi:tRNA epoxyqueuosine(34) reductase QueG [Sulfuriflexus sp.]|uniref:tRNA epoxyqueuosine(34) reductase QueG n=1 Tax=Sulfuriflexus sp. TaxID=2015443 RepID=UPI0028CD211E|nr:tRNA epoxyqueuosine(34) reductase QueG [Sulfuriflexus sp.]MDT8404888.1 tRNA epoxyqueuosine(34) reductase QueG [Sulfuriflexus sp.]